MQLIGPHQILGLLGNSSFVRRQKLRAHRRVQNIQKHIPKLLLAAGIRIVSDQVPNQSLWNRTVDPVHGHVVPIVRSPPKGQLRHIPRADDQAPHLVSHIHENLGPLPGLAVFISHIMVVRVMADIPKMCRHRLLNVDLPKLCPQPPCHDAGIMVSPVRGAKTGHGHPMDLTPGQSQAVKRPGRHKKGKGRVEAAGNPDHCVPRAGVLQPLFQPHSLDGQDLFTPSASLPLIPWHKRIGGNVPVKVQMFHLQPKLHGHVIPLLALTGRPVSVHPPPLADQPSKIQIPVNTSVAKPFGLPKACAVLRDNIVAPEHQILSGLPLPRVGVHIPAHQPGRLTADKRASVTVLSHRLVAGRTVGNNRGPGAGVADGGRTWNPHVLTDLRRQHKPRHGGTGKEKIRPHGNRLPLKLHPHRLPVSRRKMAKLVKLRIIGDV